MALASDLNVHEISLIADWYLTEETLKAASIDIINFASLIPVSRVYGCGATCSADGMRFYVPVHILAADYSHVLQGRGITLYAHTADNFLRMHQQPIPCRLREAAFSLDVLMQHDTELDPKVCYTDTHGYTEVVMATAALLELAKGENQRDRVLSSDELRAYLENCPQPWQDAATIIADEGMRPGEVFVLRWEHIFLGEEGEGLIRVVDGKSKAARRILPMTPRVYELLKARYEDQKYPAEGWVFPSQSKHGHLEVQRAKRQHATDLKDSKVAVFVPYVLRHRALTRLGKAARGDVFALAKIAGHSSITITQKYVHPEEETIGDVFSRLKVGEPASEKQVGTKSGTVKRKAAKKLAAGIAK
jgi:integrase